MFVWHSSQAESSSNTTYQFYQHFLVSSSHQAWKNPKLHDWTAVETKRSAVEGMYKFCFFAGWIHQWLWVCQYLYKWCCVVVEEQLPSINYIFHRQEPPLSKECIWEWDCKAKLPDDLIKNERYEARIRVKPSSYSSIWSDWSPTVSWVTTTGRAKPTKPPPGTFV